MAKKEQVPALVNDTVESFTPPALVDGSTAQLPEVPSEFSLSQFLPYVALVHPLSKDVKEFEAGNWVLYSMGEAIRLGPNFEAAICHYRNRAVQFAKGGGIERQTYDKDDPVFMEILKGSLAGNRGWGAGLDFLIWIPSHEIFATLFLGNVSGRIASKTVENNLHNAVTFGVREAYSRKNDAMFFAPTCVRCSTPLPFPPKEAYQLALEQFLNPPKDETKEDKEESRDL